ncbi:MAG: metal-dependent transcriptional regulator [Planctomycetota bacterium]
MRPKNPPPKAVKLSASLEDYLEAIFHIVAEKKAARAKDIRLRLRVSNSSVTEALQALAERGLVNYAPYDLITLTPEGETAARAIVRRHEALRDFFVKVLAADPDVAEETACKMEHAVPRSILERCIAFVEFWETCPRTGADWALRFAQDCKKRPSRRDCVACIAVCLEKAEAWAEGQAPREEVVSLDELAPGEKGRLVRIRERTETNRQISEMGATVGCMIEMEEVAPQGSPMAIKVKGYHLSLRREDAAGIQVERL